MDSNINKDSKGRFVKGHTPWCKGIKTGLAPWKGKERDTETMKKLQEGRKKYMIEKGHPFFGKHHTDDTKDKISKAKKYKPNPKISGVNHYLWAGGMGSIRQKSWKSIETSKWRDSVFLRDKYTCQGCGTVGGNICAHHIKEYRNYPELRLDVDNGMTLCRDCHRKTDNYGIKSLTKKPLDGTGNLTDVSVWSVV